MPPKKKPGKGKKAADTPEPDHAGDEQEKAPVNTSASLFSAVSEVERKVVKPPNQLDLTEEELSTEILTVLKSANPQAPKSIVRYDFNEQCFKPEAMVDQFTIHYRTDGWLLHKESEEGKQQIEAKKKEEAAIEDFKAAISKATEADEQEAKQYRNQFNFTERAAQTYNQGTRDRMAATEPPTVLTYSGSTTQWDIYDAYMKDQAAQQLQNESRSMRTRAGSDKKKAGDGGDDASKQKEKGKDIMHTEEMSAAAKITERVLNQNTNEDITQDFKYWNDQADKFRENEGTLLPLWKFVNDKTKKRNVTSICWNPEYPDMFAVGFGSFDFTKQGRGMICCYSLKNPSFPEFMLYTESGVMCLDFHPQQSSLLACGLYDGTVQVYDIRNKVRTPIFQSTARTGKHTDPVWQIFWEEADLNKWMQFYSISSDGRVTLWTLTKAELLYEDIMELQPHAQALASVEADSAQFSRLESGCCFDFNRLSDHLFIVGTEEGVIHKCSKSYNSQYLENYTEHGMSVYAVKWNPFLSTVFLSASADWQVKVWDHNLSKSLYSFDLNAPVADIAWAPYSSTVFAAISSDGKVLVYDLKMNRNQPICEQKISKKPRLTKVCFNPHSPVLLVGDERGCVTSLKLSPNLRKALDTEESKDNKAQADNMKQIVEIALKQQ